MLVAGFSGNPQPAGSLVRVRCNTGAGQMEQTQSTRRTRMAGFGCPAHPDRRFGIVWRQGATLRVDIANQGGGFRIAGKRRATEPGFAFRGIGIDTDALHQRQPPPGLAGPVPLFRRAAKELRSGGRIRLNAYAAFVQHAEQIESGRQIGFCGAGEVMHNALVSRVILGVSCQRKRKTERSLRAACLGRAFVPEMGLREIANVFGAGRQQIGEHGLAVGGTAFGRNPSPMGGSLEIRSLGLVVGKQQAGRCSVLGRAGCGGIACPTDAVHVERGEQRLCFDMGVAGRLFQPADAFNLAARHARRFQIAASDPVLGFRQPGSRRTDIQGERLGMLALLCEARGPAHGGGWGHQGVNPIQRPHSDCAPTPT